MCPFHLSISYMWNGVKAASAGVPGLRQAWSPQHHPASAQDLHMACLGSRMRWRLLHDQLHQDLSSLSMRCCRTCRCPGRACFTFGQRQGWNGSGLKNDMWERTTRVIIFWVRFRHCVDESKKKKPASGWGHTSSSRQLCTWNQEAHIAQAYRLMIQFTYSVPSPTIF